MSSLFGVTDILPFSLAGLLISSCFYEETSAVIACLGSFLPTLLLSGTWSFHLVPSRWARFPLIAAVLKGGGGSGEDAVGSGEGENGWVL